MSNYDPLTLANAFIQTGELDDALDALNQHLEANPEDDQARRLRVQVLSRKRDLANLENGLDDLAQLGNTTADDYLMHLRLLNSHPLLQNFEKLLQVVEKGHRHYPHDQRITERYLEYLMFLGRWQEAENLIAEQPNNWRWLQWAADLVLVFDAFDHAARYFSDALTALEKDFGQASNDFIANLKAQILLKRADVYQRLQSLSESDADYAAAEQIIPNDPMIPFNRGLIALLQGDSARGIALCRSAYTNAPDALRDEMQKALAEDKRYAPIAAALEM
jgi:tetratricopeptide (TPR) repeat protein